MPPRPRNFDEAWCSYINGANDVQDELLRECLKVAETIDQMALVFLNSYNSPFCQNVRPPTLKKMIQTIKTVDDARRVYGFASRRRGNRRGPYYFPAQEKASRVKLESFAVPA